MLNYQSSRLRDIPDSQTVAASRRAQELRAQGRDILSLTVGEPDFPTPPAVIEAAHHAALDGQTGYTPVLGTLTLRQAIARKFARENGLDFQPASEIIVGNGGKQVVYNALAASLEPGDEVILPAPHWVSYPAMIAMAGGATRLLQTDAAGGYVPDAEQIRSALTERSRWLILNFPGNPTGAIASPQALRAIADVVRAHPRLLVLSDEIYEHICFDGLRSPAFLSLAPDLRDRVLTVNGVSKAYAMTGWRIGYGAGPAGLVKAMAKLQSQTTGSACAISQAAAAAALDGPSGFLSERAAAFQRRRDLVLERLAGCRGLRPFKPLGAFYLLCEVVGRSAEQAEAELLDAGVAVVGGAAFGAPNHLRLSIAASDALLAQACDRILQVLG